MIIEEIIYNYKLHWEHTLFNPMQESGGKISCDKLLKKSKISTHTHTHKYGYEDLSKYWFATPVKRQTKINTVKDSL